MSRPSVLRPPRLRYGRSEEHTSELQSRSDLVCRLLLEKKKKRTHDKRLSDHLGPYNDCPPATALQLRPLWPSASLSSARGIIGELAPIEGARMSPTRRS